jgi:hypothetical protein
VAQEPEDSSPHSQQPATGNTVTYIINKYIKKNMDLEVLPSGIPDHNMKKRFYNYK